MDTAAAALLIIVSATLSVFLIVGIIALTKLIDILNHVKRITEKAEEIADRAEAVSEFFQKTAAPAAVANMIGNIVNSFKDHKSKGRKQ